MDSATHLQGKLEHAQWRVRFARSLLDVHQHCVDTTNESWWLEEADLLQRLASAEEELALQKREKAG
jgi:hypothetical protein